MSESGWLAALASPSGAWALALATTLLAILESSRVRWAPFLILYALVLPLPAWFAGTAAFGPPGKAFAGHPVAIAALSLAILAWEHGVFGLGYETWARGKGALRARFSPTAAMDALIDETARRRGLASGGVQAWAGVYFLVWAPLAEELFFWGFLYPLWRPVYGVSGAAALVALWFAARHAAHFLFLPRPYPWPAALAFMASTGGAAFGNGWLLEIGGSLWPLIALHFLSNLLSMVLPKGPSPVDGSAPLRSPG